MVTPHDPLQTARLVLRPFASADLDDLFGYISRPDVVRYLYSGVKVHAESELTLKQWISATSLSQAGDRLVLAVELVEQRKVIGEVTLKLHSREDHQTEIGWVFHPDYGGTATPPKPPRPCWGLASRNSGFIGSTRAATRATRPPTN